MQPTSGLVAAQGFEPNINDKKDFLDTDKPSWGRVSAILSVATECHNRQGNQII